MSTDWKPGDSCVAFYPGDPAPRMGEIIGRGYGDVAYRVRFENGAVETFHRNYLYAPGEPITRRPEAWEKDVPPGRPGKPAEAKAPKTRKPPGGVKVSAKNRKHLRAILALALKRKLAKSVTPKHWEGDIK